ncbi:hypothetical protein KUTeg_005912 [Tegillarca granosa]|uniref:Uncharacterized protein n=1 Tax=Tegillarca granosa TaxID=220873 RepID=A0ABQ9FJU0_TEGGR|nr:hypothetical protein KUTeg_005912 [Tegillarca granosa]
MAKRFQDKTALVSGGSRGIGKAVAERLLQEGAKVYVIGRSKENLDKIKAVNKSAAKVEDIMEATIFLLSEDAAMITGSTLAVDGGFLLK